MSTASLPRRRIRLVFDAAVVTANINDMLSGKAPVVPRGNALDVECAVALNAAIVDISIYASFKLEVFDNQTGTGSPRMSKTILAENFNTGLTDAHWNDGTEQHFKCSFANNETNIAPPVNKTSSALFMVLSGTTLDGDDVTIGWTGFTVINDRAGEGIAPAPIIGAFPSSPTADTVLGGDSDGFGWIQRTASQLLSFLSLSWLSGLSLDTDPTLAANSDTSIPSQKAVASYVNGKIVGLQSINVTPIDASANPNYPAALRGQGWQISVAGKIGGASGMVVQSGDIIVALADNAGGTQAAVGASWTIVQANLVEGVDYSTPAQLATETAARTAADTTLTTNIAANAAAITAETTARILGDTGPGVASAIGAQLIAALQVAWPANAGTFHFATMRSTAGGFSVKTTTGYARLINADGTLGTQAGTGVAGNDIILTTPASGIHRPLGVVSVALAGSVRSGNITDIHVPSMGVSAVADLSIFTGLTYFAAGINQLTVTPSFAGLTALTYLILNDNYLTTPPVFTGLAALKTVNLTGNRFMTLSFAGLNPAVISDIEVGGNLLTSVSNVPPLNVGFNQLLDISNNLLPASELNASYTALGASPSGKNNAVAVNGNPGTSSDTPSIATGKGWTVVGS